MSKNKFWKFVKNEATSNSELILEGVIASESWYGDEATPKLFRDDLAAHTGNLTIRMNSPGGDVYAGVQMYNMLKDRNDGEVTVIVDALAASIASVIAMAGDKIIMNTGSQMMIHKPWTMAIGNSDEMRETADYLEKVGESIMPIYASRTGKPIEVIAELLDKGETWFTASEAVEAGFADEAAEGKTKLSDTIKNALSNIKNVENAVLQPAMSLKAKLEEADVADEQEVVDESTEVSKEADVEETDTTPEAETETEAQADVEVEADAEEETTKVNNKETIDMSKQETIAQSQVIAPANQASVDETPIVNDYLSTMQSVKDFTEVLYQNVGKQSKDVRAAWHEKVAQNGITNPSILDLPSPLVTEIKDAVEASQIYQKFNHTGLDSLKVLWDDADKEVDTSRAGQHNPTWNDGSGVDKTKDQQVLTFEERELEADYIYKYLILDKKTIRKNRGSGALMRFVMRELPQRIIREMERAAIIGDGRGAGTKRKITSFISVKSDVVADNDFGATYVPGVGESRYESVARAGDLLLSEGTRYLIAKKGFSTGARFEKNNSGDLLFPIGTKPEDIFAVSEIIEPSWFTDATDTAYDAYLVVLGEYNTVGDNSIESFTNFKLETNENEFLQEIYKGGGLTGLKAAVGISNGTSS